MAIIPKEFTELKFNSIILILLLLIISNSLWSQKNTSPDFYPHIENDYAETNNLLVDLYLQLGVYCVSGVGVNSSYFLSDKLYSSFNLGYGAALGWNYEPKFEPGFGMMNLDIRGGYILFSDLKPNKTSKALIKENVRYSEYKTKNFNVVAPKHRYLIAELGFSRNPTSWYAYSSGGAYKAGYNFYAPVLNLGLRWKTIRNAYVKVRDEGSNDTYSGRLSGYSEIYGGFVLPLKNQIEAPNVAYQALTKSNKIGFSIFVKSTLGVGINSALYVGYSTVGYSNASHYTLGTSIYIGSGWKIR